MVHRAAAQEERFTRKKFDARFPTHAIRYCLQRGGISLADLKHFVFYDKPLIKFERLLETYVAFSPKGVKSFLAAMPVWLKEKLLLKSVLQDELVSLDGLKKSELPSLLFESTMNRTPPRRSIHRRSNQRWFSVWMEWGSGPPRLHGWVTVTA
jgi:predicted NodU family carbamoyl transferase